MSLVLNKQAFPKVHTVRDGDWTLTIKCEGVYTEFVFATAQAGDPKGSAIIEGPKMSVSVGTDRDTCPCCLTKVKQFPVNLSKGRELIRKLGEKLRNNYNIEPNWPALLELGNKAFEPYDKYFSY